MICRTLLSWPAALLLACTLTLGPVQGQQTPTNPETSSEEFQAPIVEGLLAVISAALILYIVCKPTGRVSG